MKELEFNEVPSWFPLCHNTQCPKAATCLRQMAAKAAPAETAVRPCVLPGQWNNEACDWYAEAKTTLLGRGFTQLFNRVYDTDGKAMRKELLSLFRYKKKYYACLKGEMPLTAEEQQFIRRMVVRRGYDWEVVFDHEEEHYDFPYKRY